MNAVFIPIETKVREFDGRMLLGHQLAMDGYQVFIGSKGGIKREIFSHKNAIYLPKSVSKTEVEFYKKLRAQGCRIALHHAEGGVYYKDFKESILYCYPLEIIELVDLIFVFGNEIKKAIHTYLPQIPESKVIIAGDPRFDLLKPKYRSISSGISQQIEKEFGKFILVNTSFGLANPRMGKEWVDTYYSSSPDILPDQRINIFHKRDVTLHVLGHFINMVKKLSKAIPDCKIVVRPHPEESLDIYLKEFSSYKNIFVRMEGSALNWIFAAQAVIHYDCTTGIESVIAGKETISFTPIKDDSILAWLPIFVSKEFPNENDLIEFISTNISNSNLNQFLEEEKSKVLGSFINNVFQDSAPIISSSIKDKIKFKEKSVSLLDYRIILKRAKTYVSHIRAVRNAKKLNLKLKFPKVTPSEVKGILESFNKINKSNAKFKVTSCGLDVVKFSKI